MGKRLKQQVRGSATGRYVVPDRITKYKLEYPKTDNLNGIVEDIIDSPIHTSLIAKVKFGDQFYYLPAVEGMYIGQEINSSGIKIGNILALRNIPDGYYISFVELKRGDGGKLLRSAGAYGVLLSKDENWAYVKMPSKKVIKLPLDARAMIGIVSGAGVKEKPLVKAGNAYYRFRKLHRIWPRPRGVKMSPYDHPHGGKQHHEGKPTTISRNAAPGQKVGHIAARSTGRKKNIQQGDKNV